MRHMLLTTIGLFAISLLILVSQTPEMFDRTILNGMFIQNEFTFFVKFLIILGIIASLALAPQYLAAAQIMRFEYPILVEFAIGIVSYTVVVFLNFIKCKGKNILHAEFKIRFFLC